MLLLGVLYSGVRSYSDSAVTFYEDLYSVQYVQFSPVITCISIQQVPGLSSEAPIQLLFNTRNSLLYSSTTS